MLAVHEVFSANRLFSANEVCGIENDDESIKKLVEPKTRKLSKSQKLSKSWNLAKSRKHCQKIAIHQIIVIKR